MAYPLAMRRAARMDMHLKRMPRVLVIRWQAAPKPKATIKMQMNPKLQRPAPIPRVVESLPQTPLTVMEAPNPKMSFPKQENRKYPPGIRLVSPSVAFRCVTRFFCRCVRFAGFGGSTDSGRCGPGSPKNPGWSFGEPIFVIDYR